MTYLVTELGLAGSICKQTVYENPNSQGWISCA